MKRDVLAFIKWVEHLLWREEHRSDPTVEWQPDMSWAEMGRDAVCMAPGDLEPAHEIDKYLPEYVGLLDTQLYWPGRPSIEPVRAVA
jgi:hypothetical protein